MLSLHVCLYDLFYVIIHHLRCSLIQRRSPYYRSPILKVVCYSKKQIVPDVNHLYGMHFHSKVQKKLFALPFMRKVCHLSFPEQYTVHLDSSEKKFLTFTSLYLFMRKILFKIMCRHCKKLIQVVCQCPDLCNTSIYCFSLWWQGMLLVLVRSVQMFRSRIYSDYLKADFGCSDICVL